jgi:hypothetical protein
MKSLLLILALFSGQLPSRDREPIVVLPPNHPNITFDYGGKYLQLKNASAVVHLPKTAPKPLASGVPWYVDVVNFGPNDVTIQANEHFSVRLQPKDSVRVVAADSVYKVVH